MTACTVYTVVLQYVLVITVVFVKLLVQVLFTETQSASSCQNQRFEKSLLRKSTRCFDIIGLLIILVQVNLSSPVERV